MSQIGKPAIATSHTGKPATSYTGKRSNSHTGKPSSSHTGKCSNSHTGKPSNSHTGKPFKIYSPFVDYQFVDLWLVYTLNTKTPYSRLTKPQTLKN